MAGLVAVLDLWQPEPELRGRAVDVFLEAVRSPTVLAQTGGAG